MQNTLLALGIALVLALISAMVAPRFIDWDQYRAAVETDASRVIGFDVRVNGTIEARLLPSPALTLHNVAIGEPGEGRQLRAGTLKVELALGPLLRGQLQASNLHLVSAQLYLGLDRSGALNWLASSPSLRPQAYSISHFDVKDGRIILTDAASGSRFVLRKIRFDGNIGSFAGSFNGQGAVVAGDELYRYRISGRPLEGAGIKIALSVEPSNHPLSTDFKGTLTFERGVPQFSGTMALARPVGATLANGRRVVSSPWRAAGALRVTPASASIRRVAFRYGPEERPLNFSGNAELTFGSHPHLRADVSALQVDVDRALAAPDLTDRPPLIMIRSFLQAFAAAAKLPLPAQIGVGIDALTVGGITIESVRGELNFSQSGWRVDSLQFRAPGMTDVKVSGRLTGTAAGFSFNGPAEVKSADFDTLIAWLNDRAGNTPSGEAKTMSARGVVTVASDRMAVEKLTAMLDHERMAGNFVYEWPQADHPARLDAELQAAELNVDGLAAFAKSAVSSSGMTMPREGALAFDINKATFLGVQAEAVNAQIEFDAGKLHIDRLSVGDLGGATLDVSGRMDELSSQPRGQLTLDIDARALDGLRDIAAKFAPQAAVSLRRAFDRLAPAKIHAVLTVARAPSAGSTAQFQVKGSLATMRAAISGNAIGELSHLGDATFQFDSRIDADDGSALVALLGLDRFLAVDQLPGQLILSAEGRFNGNVQLDGRVSASGFDSAVEGVLRFHDRPMPTGMLQVTASAGDWRPLHQAMTGQLGAAVPVSMRAGLAVKGAKFSFTHLAATVGKAALKGRLDLTLANPIRIGGDIEAERADVASVMAALLGLPSTTRSGAPWSSKPIGAGAFGAILGDISFTLDHSALTAALASRGLKGTAHFRPSEIALTNLDGSLAGGRVTGALVFRRDPNGLAVQARLKVLAAAATILGPSISVADGVLTGTLQCDGFGTTPIGLIGSLHGNAAIDLKDAQFAALDLAAFDAAIQAAGQSSLIDMAKVQAAVNAKLANGRLVIPKINATIPITSGAFNMNHLTLPAQGRSELSLGGLIDLSKLATDLRITLSEAPPAHALIQARPELSVIVNGPITAPKRTTDISSLVSWLTLNAAELQTRRIELIESDQRLGTAGSDVHASSPGHHIVPPGALVESIRSPNLSIAPSSGTPRTKRLQQSSAPVAVPDQGAPRSANRPDGAAGPTVPAPAPPRKSTGLGEPRAPARLTRNVPATAGQPAHDTRPNVPLAAH